MSNPIKVLLVEDSLEDTELLELELRRRGYDPILKRVETKEEMCQGIREDEWDIIISDYALPAFNGMEALK